MSIDPEKIKQTTVSNPSEKDIFKEIREQKQILLKIYKQTKKTKKYILFGRLISLFYILVILGFFAVGLKILSPLINKVNSIMLPYGDLLGNQELQNVDIEAVNSLLKKYQR